LNKCFAEFLAGLEARVALGSYRDGLASPRITALPLLLLLHNEAAKPAQIDTFVCLQRFGDASKKGLRAPPRPRPFAALSSPQTAPFGQYFCFCRKGPKNAVPGGLSRSLANARLNVRQERRESAPVVVIALAWRPIKPGELHAVLPSAGDGGPLRAIRSSVPLLGRHRVPRLLARRCDGAPSRWRGVTAWRNSSRHSDTRLLVRCGGGSILHLLAMTRVVVITAAQPSAERERPTNAPSAPSGRRPPTSTSAARSTARRCTSAAPRPAAAGGAMRACARKGSHRAVGGATHSLLACAADGTTVAPRGSSSGSPPRSPRRSGMPDGYPQRLVPVLASAPTSTSAAPCAPRSHSSAVIASGGCWRDDAAGPRNSNAGAGGPMDLTFRL